MEFRKTCGNILGIYCFYSIIVSYNYYKPVNFNLNFFKIYSFKTLTAPVLSGFADLNNRRNGPGGGPGGGGGGGGGWGGGRGGPGGGG